MGKLLSFYNQNRKTIWISIIAIVFAIAIIHILNNIAVQNAENRMNEKNTVITTEKDYKENPNINVQISTSEVKEDKELIIDQFIRYCNAKDIEGAYGLLSDNCKKNVYTSLEMFNNNYISLNFNTVKLYSKEKYKNKTYKVNLYENVASTGALSQENIEDYFTIVEENKEVKLNISGFIDEKSINKTSKNALMEISVLKEKIYKEKVVFEIQVRNLTNNDILLDSKEKSKTVYALDSNEVASYALLYQNSANDIMIPANITKTIYIEFNENYGNSSKLETINFTDVIKNYKLYKDVKNKSEYKDRAKATISI